MSSNQTQTENSNLHPIVACLALIIATMLMALILTAPALAGDWPNYNFMGGDYHNFETTSGFPGQECRQACIDDHRCRAATLVDAGIQSAGPMCWLKDSEFEILEDGNTNSWMKPEYYAAVADQNRLGQDYASYELPPGQGSMDCRRLCQGDDNCRSFTYVEPGLQAAGGMCWLKDGVPEPSRAEGCHSGLIYERTVLTIPEGLFGVYEVVETEETTPMEVVEVVGLADLVIIQPRMDNVNLPGMDYFNFELPVDDPEMCQMACERDSSCRAYTYIRPGIQGDFARCWLKDAIPDQVTDYNAVSGVLR